MHLDNNGVELAYDDDSTGAPPVLFLHGLGEARSTWQPFLPAVARAHRSLALDFRGHGESAHAPGTYFLEHYVSDGLALFDQLSLDTVVVVGHSLGGVVGLTLAQRRPELVAGLLLEDPPLYWDEGSAEARPAVPFFSLLREFTQSMQARQAPLEEYERTLAAVPSRGGGAGSGGTGSMADLLGPERTRALALGLARLDPDVFLPALDGTGLRGVRRDVAVACPVLVLRADPAFSPAFSEAHAASFQAVNPHATVKMVPGASHLLHDEQPDRFLTELESFLVEVEPDNSSG